MLGPGRRCRVEMLKWLGDQTPDTSPATPFAAFSETTINDDATGLTEPTAGTGGYAAQSISWTAVPTPTAGQAAVLANSNTIAWGPSSAAWSSGSTPLPYIGVFNHVTTRDEANFIGAMAVAVPRVVDASGIELESVAGDLQFTMAPT